MAQQSAGDLVTAGPSSSRSSGNRGAENGSDVSSATSLTTIDDIVSFIRSINASSNDVQNALLPSLLKIFHSHKGKGQKTFLNSLQDEVEPLSMLDPSINTLGYSAILGLRAFHTKSEDEARPFMPLIANFAQVYDPIQWLGAGEFVTILVRGIIHVAQLVKDLVWANPSLLRILDGFRRIEGGENNLTTIHVSILYHLLRTAHYETAMDWILQYDIISADAKITPLLYSDILEYFYYGGIVSAKVGKLEKACDMLQLCVATPAQAVSAIQIDAYKKLTIVHLLHHDEPLTLPSYTSQAVLKAIRGGLANLEAYFSFVKAYKFEEEVKLQTMEGELQRIGKRYAGRFFKEVVQSKSDTFYDDQNMGLIKLLIDDHLPRRIARLSKVVARISIGEIIQLLQLEEDYGYSTSEACLHTLNGLRRAQSMQWINVIIPTVTGPQDLPSAIIVFEETPSNVSNGVSTAQELMEIMKESHRWNKIVEEKERSLAESEIFLGKIINSSRSAFSGLSMDEFDEDAFL